MWGVLVKGPYPNPNIVQHHFTPRSQLRHTTCNCANVVINSTRHTVAGRGLEAASRQVEGGRVSAGGDKEAATSLSEAHGFLFHATDGGYRVSRVPLHCVSYSYSSTITERKCTKN